MTSQNRLVEDRGGERAVNRSVERSGFLRWGKPAPARYTHDSSPHGTEWERHVMIALWISVAVLIALVTCFVYAEFHGLFSSAPHQPTPLPSWPVGWP